jgi:exonuclease SbcC
MKILKLRLKNLNSLNGTWEIDFTNQDYISNGIFAITGPTGAGKSTILDAICLALYGSTPRLEKLTTSANEIMSRRTGECFAELEFSTKKGIYKVNWSQHRAYRKPEGKLNDYHHTLYDSEGRIIENSKRETPNKVKNLTGLDFKQFIRSILLPQGGFAAFLQASPKERAPILEEITGTEIYSEISIKVHEIYTEKRRVLELLKAETRNIEILTEEEETEVRKKTEELITKEKELRAANKLLLETINRIENINKLKEELKSLEESKKETEKLFKEFEPNREKLTLALKAQTISSEYTVLNETRKNTKKIMEELQKYKKLLPEINEKSSSAEKAMRKTEELLKKYKSEYEKLKPVLKMVREKDIQISGHNKIKLETEKQKREYELEIKEINKAIKSLDKKLSTLEKEKKESAEYLNKNRKDEKIIEILGGVKEQIKYITEKNKDAVQSEKEINIHKKNIEDSLKQIKKSKLQLETINKKMEMNIQNITKLNREKNNLLNGRMLREIRTEKDSKLRELNYIAKINTLEEERKYLEDGKPCPLCGSLTHPFAAGNIPQPTSLEKEIVGLNELIENIEKLEKQIEDIEKKHLTEKEDFNQKQSKLTLLEQEKENITSSLTRTEKNFKILLKNIEESRNKLLENISEFGFDASSLNTLSLITDSLSTRMNLWDKYTKITEDIDKKISESVNEKEKLTIRLNTITETSARLLINLNSLVGKIKEFTTEREKIFGNKEPDKEEKELTLQIEKAEKELNKNKDYADKLKAEKNTLETKISQLDKNIKDMELSIKELKINFQRSCENAGFENEEEFIKNSLSQTEQTKLNEESKKLDALKTSLNAKYESTSKKLVAEKEKISTEKPLDELKQEQSQLSEKLSTLLEETGGLKLRLKNNKELKAKLESTLKKIAEAEKDLKNWLNLHSLIGSSEGKKFREFAQGLTFQIMVSYANKQLKTMTDRYLLIRDKNSPLELNVIDNYQAGEERSTKNLSGGESFIVSLALALGLSNMASKNVSIDSLFLDEGFGTLDEDSLEMALESLSTLQQENKLIGIISHVDALKERINTQINVIPKNGGKSIITGPGCKAI